MQIENKKIKLQSYVTTQKKHGIGKQLSFVFFGPGGGVAVEEKIFGAHICVKIYFCQRKIINFFLLNVFSINMNNSSHHYVFITYVNSSHCYHYVLLHNM